MLSEKDISSLSDVYYTCFRPFSQCASDIQDNRKDHRIPLDLLEDEIVHFVLDLVLQVRPVFTREAVFRQDITHQFLCLVNDILVFLDVDKAARDDLRVGEKLMVIGRVYS